VRWPALLGAVLLLMVVSLLAVARSASAETYGEVVEGTAGVSHFWPMGESSGSSFADVIGGANAEVSGGVTLGQSGGLIEDPSTSAAFDGSSGAAQAPIDLSGTSKVTIEFWMKWTAFAGDDHLALEFTPNFNSNPGGFLVDPDATPGSDFAVALGNGSTNNNVLFERPSAEQWHYYAFVIDTKASAESEITPYVDGHAVSYTKLNSGIGAGNFAESTLYWMSRDASTLFGAGSMQDLALYTTTLSPSTILEHYAYGVHGPQAAFSSSPVVATAGVPVHFDASGTKSPAGVSDYAWDFDGSKTYSTDGASSSTTSHTFSSPGTYTVDLQVEDGLGQKGTVSRTVTVGAALGSYEKAVEETSDVSHFWPMGESSGSSFADVVGGADAASTGGVSLGEPGGLVEDSSTSAAFDGSSGAAQAPVDLSGTHKLTIEFWMKWHAYGADDRLAMEFTPNFNSYTGGFLVDPDATPGSDFAVAVGKGGTANTVFFTRPSAEQWHYYTFVIDTEASGEAEIKPYVDGKTVSYTKSSSNEGAGAFASSTLFWMSRNASELFGAGSMQDIALYEGTLSSETILEHYALGEHGPKAAFTSSPAVATAGVPVHFDASGSTSPTGPVSDYSWDFNGSKSYASDSGSTGTISHTFSSPGTYTVDLQVEDSLGEKATVSKTITVGAALGQYEQAVEGTSGIAHFWPMNESSGSTLADAVGGADATTSGGTTLGEPGGLVEDLSTSAAFDGTSGAAQANVDLSGTQKLTVEFWMKWKAYGADDHLALEFTPNFNEHAGGFLVDPDATPGSDFAVAVGQSSTGHNNNVLFERPSAEHWHYYAFVIDTEASGESEITPYVDGHAVSYTKLSSDTGAGNFAYSTLNWMSRNTTELFGAGSMQDLALYESTLSSETILEHYEWGQNTYKPTNTTAPSIEGTPREGETLTANPGSWSGAEPISFGYQWRRCNSSGESCSDISGATSSTYDAGFEDSRHKLRVLVTATNAAGSGEALSSTSAFVAPASLTEFGYASEFGELGSGDGQFKEPFGVAIGSNGDVYVLDRGNDRVEKFNEAGEYLGQFGTEGSGDGQLSFPDALAVDPKGDVFVADTGNERVEEFNEHGEFLRTFGEGLTGSAEGIAVDRHGRVWVSATYEGHLVVFGEDGEYLKGVGSHGSEPGEFVEPEGLAVDAEGHVWVADFRGRVEEFDEETGEYLSQFGSDGGGVGQLSSAYGIAVDAGHVFVGEGGRVQEFNEEGGFIAQLGVPGSEAGELGYSVGLAIDPAHDLLIADYGNNRVEEWSPEAPGVPANLASPSISGAPGVGSTLATSAGVWRGSPRRSYSYQWEQCNEHGEECADVVGATSSTYLTVGTDLGSTLRVVVTATNSYGSASSTSAATEPIGLPPVNISPPTISGTAEEGQELSAELGTWEDAGDYRVQWQRCNEHGEECSNLEVEEWRYTLTAADVGHTLRAVVYAKNEAGETPATSESTSVVVAAPKPPSNTALPSVSGTAQDGQSLSASTGSWEGAPTISYLYQWESCNGSGEDCSDISGATGSTYVLHHGAVGMTLRVVVTATNSLGSTKSTSNTSGVVAALTPYNISAPRISGTTEEGQTLITSSGNWDGTPTISYAYQWQSCDSLGEGCMDISGATGSSYMLQASDVGSTVRVVVTASNAGGSASAPSKVSAVFASVPHSLTYVTQFGSEGSGDGQFDHPGDVAIDPGGDLFVLDRGNDRVEVFSEAGEYLRQFGSAGSGNGQMSGPDGLAVNSEGDVWVLDTGNGRIEEFSESGVFMRTAGAGLVGTSEGIAVDRHGDVWVSVTYEGHLVVFNGEGEYLKTVGSEGSAPGQLDEPEGLTVDTSGDVWVAEWSNNRVQEFNEAGEYLSEFGSAGSGAGEISSPYGITAGGGHVFVGEIGNDRVQEFDESGKYIGQLSRPGSEPGDLSLSYPMGLAVGSGGDLWVTDSGNDRVEELTIGVPPLSLAAPTISGSAQDRQTLSASEGEWEGAPPLTYTYQWEGCNATGGECEDITGAAAASYTLADGDVGGSVRVVVTASNSAGSASASSAVSVRIAPVAPVNTSLSSISGSAVEGQTLSADPGVWSGAPTPSYTYQWERCDESGEACADIAGATGSTYRLGAVDVEQTLRVRVVATNAASSATASSSATGPVESTGAVAPSNTESPSISGSPEDGQTLSASTGAWAGTAPLSYAYQWQSCNEAGSDCEAIEGATEPTYTLDPTDEQTTLRVLVTVSGPGGRTQAFSEASATIQAGAPSEFEAPSISGSPSIGEALYADAGEWGGSEVRFSYQWEHCNEAGAECRRIPGASEAEYTPGEGDAASTLRVRIGASNALGSLTALSPVSTPVQPAGVLLNTAAPTISGEPASGGTLSASPGGWLGSDVISYIYEWQRCDLYGVECKEIEGAGASTYSPVVADVGYTLRVRVSASELEGAASGISSTTAPVAATGAPVAQGSPSVAGTGLVGYTLTATAGAWSGEAGETSYGYQWVRCNEEGEECSSISGATVSSYTLSTEDAGSAIRALVSATNLSGTSKAASAPVIASAKGIADAALPFVSGSDQLGRPLQANTGIWTGSGAITFAYEWQRCNEEGESCTAISGATGSTYSPVEADSRHALRVKVTATGLEGPVSEISTATPPIGSEATAPENTAVPSIEGNLTKGDALKADIGSWSGSEPITHTYHWQRCNLLDAACVEIEGASSDTYTLTEADVGTRIQVLVGASNSAGSESATSEASEEVGAIGVPADTQEPVTTGQAVEGQRLFVENGRWSGSKSLTYYYRWERCNTVGESCVTITGANRPSYPLVAADVGATIRVNVTAANGLGSAGSVSPHTDVVITATQASISAAREAIEGADPSLLARSTSATIEEQSLTPAITDSGEEISSQSTLASSTISKATPGEFSLETSAGQISLTPLKPSLSADAMPTIANGTAALFAETWHESDTIVRPSVLGAIALLQLRSEHAPTSESWEVNLGTRQQLEQLSNGSVAIIEPTPEVSLESPPGEEGPTLGGSEALAHEEGEGFDQHKGEEELNSSLAEESSLGPLSAAPTISVTETSPKEHELHPQDTKEHYEHDKSAMGYAEEHTSDTALMVIEAPTVIDAADHTVPATLAVEGDTITLTISPEPEASYPITAEVATTAPTDLVSIARDPVEYGLSDPKETVFEELNSGLTKAPLNIKVARDVVPYYAWQTASGREDLLKWLQAVGEHKNLKPYITVEVGEHTNITYTEYKADMHELISELMNGKEEVEVSGKKFKDIPAVKLWGAWNEPDIKNILEHNAQKAALLWKIADAIGGELHCGCKIAAGEFYEFDGHIKEYINTILHDSSYGTARPSVWGFHDYYDLENLQRHTEEHKGNVDLEKFLEEIKGTPKIWISETGVVLQNGGKETKLKAGGEHARLQVAAANDVLKLANGHSRIELINYYLYEGPSKEYDEKHRKPHAFDSALVAGALIPEKQKPREAYCVLVLNIKKGCPAGGITKGAARESVTAEAATMTASVEPRELPTTYLFEYGTTTAYGLTTSVTSLTSEVGEQSVTTALSGLEPCTTYHYQVEAENEANEGVASLGGDQSFATSCPGLITAFAGDGDNKRSGDGGEATEAGLERIGGLAAGSDDNVFIAEPGLNNIREVNSEGIIDRVEGLVDNEQGDKGDGGPAIEAHLGEPSALAVSADGTVYVAEDWSQVVRASTPVGGIYTFAGKRPAINHEGRCGPTTERLYSGDGGPAGEAGFAGSLTLAVGPDGSLYIADWNDEVVRRVNPDGTITTVAGYFDPGALKEHKIYNAFDPSELLCEFTSYEPETPSLSGDGGPATSATLGEPTAVAVGSDGSIYISDPFDDVIRRVAPDGTISTFAGTGEVGYSGDGGPAAEAKLDDPAGLAVGPDGSVYIADACNAVIRRVASDGIITTVAGTGERGEGGDGGSATEAQLENSTLIAADSDGNLYVGSNETHKVRKIEAPLGAGTTNDEGGDTCPSEGGGGGG
jgi:sugar lactone lactonase YvrE/plastocyanin